MKCVIVIDHTLPLGLIANTSAVLAISIGNKLNEIVGNDVLDRDGYFHTGITKYPIPILKGNGELIRSLRTKLMEESNEKLFYVDFCDVAQRSKDYEQYKTRIREIPTDKLYYLGIAICGPDKIIKSLTGSIGLLR